MKNNSPASYPTAAILIPCYNCGSSLLPVVKGCRVFSDRIILVNDGSTDQTSEYMQQTDSTILGWKKNRGKGAALKEGFQFLLEKPDWEVVITLDSDGQHNPEDISHFLQRYQKTQADVIIGKRDFRSAPVPIPRRWANTLSSKTISLLTGIHVSDFQCGFRLYSRHAIELLLPLLISPRYAIETEMTLLASKLYLKIEEIGVQCIYTNEAHQRSHWKPLKDSFHIARVVLKSTWKGNSL